MKFFLICLLFVLAISPMHAWTGLEEFNPNGNHTSHCFGASFNIRAMDQNEVKRIEGKCAEAECLNNRGIKLTGCAPMAAEPPCYVIDGDISKPFPECCYEIRCDDNNSLEYTNRDNDD